jgi:3'(2'), 5'-bisphosphate nucleotidase
MDLEILAHALEPIVRSAGTKIMAIHNQDPDVDFKSDGSPVTEADRTAEAIILAALNQLAPDIVVISEENAASHSLKAPYRYFLVDPLDGTKEFLKRDCKGSFTVNIALIENRAPIMGIVYAPALDRLFIGIDGKGANEKSADTSKALSIRIPPASGALAVASASHRDDATNKWLAEHDIANTVSIGSSLKFCLVAAGEADVYPRFGPTMEWDTGAGDAVLRAAGGHVTHLDKSVFLYGKPKYRNDSFIAWGGFKPIQNYEKSS